VVKLEQGTAIAAISLGVVEIFRLYRDTAPTLEAIRRAQPGDYVMRQLILDADMLGLILVLAVGGGATFLTRRAYPLVLSVGSLALISMYYRMVLNSTNEGMM
jgi:hypothetical protein